MKSYKIKYSLLIIACLLFSFRCKSQKGVLANDIPASANDTIMLTGALSPHQYEGRSCDSLRIIRICNGSAVIPEWVFAVCPSLESVSFCNDVRSVSDNSFFSCKNLRFVSFGAIKSIGECAFKNTGIVSLDLANVSQVGEFAFSDCSDLLKVLFPSSDISIGDFAFSKDSLLQNVAITYGSIGIGAFMGCKSLKELHLEHVDEIGEAAFLDCVSLSDIELPQNLTQIQPMTFMNCTNIKSINLPNNLQIIEESAFNGTAIENIIIPSSVRRIESDAFANCKCLKSVCLMSDSIVIDDNAFDANVKIIKKNNL